jgi:hypothetical protein
VLVHRSIGHGTGVQATPLVSDIHQGYYPRFFCT